MSELAKALLAAQKKMPQLHKDSTADVPTKTGGKFSYSYLSLEALLGVVLPVLNTHGIALTQAPVVHELGFQGLKTTLLHETGESMETVMKLPAGADAAAQAQGSAITYARRYSILCVLALAPDEDDDGKAASAPRQQQAAPAAKANGAKATQAQHAKHNALLAELEKIAPKAEGQRSWEEDARTFTQEKFTANSRSQLTKAQMAELIEWTQHHVDKHKAPFA